VLWADLVALRDAGELIPGQQYRITDYECTTVQANTQSAGHQFDIIVTAGDVDKLNENARACLHEGDTYFVNSKLEAWKLKYCLDNDVNRFAWADEVNGKGVIYRMVDEFNNDVPYDFKNILFVKNGIEAFTFGTVPGINYNQWGTDYAVTRNEALDVVVSEVQYYGYTCSATPSAWSTPNFWIMEDSILTSSTLYAISGETVTEINYGGTLSILELSDGSLTNNTRNNVMQPLFSRGPDFYSLNFNTFGVNCYDNTFGNNCDSNTFGNGCYSNTFGGYCKGNTFGNGCNSNTFGNSCYSNTFGNSCSYNTFGDNCRDNTFSSGCYYNTFDNNCSYNAFGGYCSYNTFGNRCSYNTFGNNCESNTFGNGCYYLQISTNSGLKYISVDNGTRGASSANKFDLYDPAILDKNYQVTFKKSPSGKYLMLWATDTGTMTGKVKDSNVDDTWTELE
jgi:hypothetical protein